MLKYKKLTNRIIGGVMAVSTLLPGFGYSQTTNYTAKEKPMMEVESSYSSERGIRDGFYGDQYFNPFVQPNVLNGGEFTLNYYGSGDSDGNNVLDWNDYYNFEANERTDINGDGVAGTQADKDILEDYLLDNTAYLPAHWEFQNETGKISRFENYYNNVDITDEHPPGPDWDCDQYSIQFMINSTGVENIEGSPLDPNLYDFSHNAQGNMPGYFVSTSSTNGVGHAINAILVGDNPEDFNSWYFYDPQSDEWGRVHPGDPSMDENSFAYIQRYAYFWSDIDNQYMYNMNGIIEFDLEGGEASITWEHPSLVVNQPVEQSYKHPGGEMPSDVTIDYQYDNPNYSDPSNTGNVEGVADWASVIYSDSITQTGGNWDSSHYNFEIFRSWKAVSDYSPIIDTTYGSINPVYNRPAQVITVQDTTRPYFTYVEGDQDLLFSEYSPADQSTGGDNSGVYAIGRNVSSDQGEDPNSCDFYNFDEIYTDSIYDPSGNWRDTTFTFSVSLDPNQWDSQPADTSVIFGTDVSPDNLGWATAFNPAGVGVNITYEDDSNQGEEGTCEFINYDINRTWTAEDSICGSTINYTQTIHVSPAENQWDFFPDDWQGIYSSNLDLSPENTGGYAEASNPSGLEVIVTYDDDSNQSSDPLNCAHYNFSVDRTWTATEETCGTSISDVQELDVTKPMSLMYTSFPDDIDIDYNESMDPENTGEPTGVDTLASEIPVSYIYNDSLIEDTPTYTIWDRYFELTEDVCGTQTDSDSTQRITVYKEVGVHENNLADRVTVYPNPTDGKFSIRYQFDTPEQITTEIYDFSGQLMRRQSIPVPAGSETAVFDISELTNGLYFIKIGVSGGQFTYFRIVKQ